MPTPTTNPLPPLDERQRYSVQEAVRYLRISAPTLYKSIARGELRTIKHGARTFISGAEIARLST